MKDFWEEKGIWRKISLFAVIFRLFLGSFEGEGGAFLDLGPRKDKDFS